MIWLDPHSGRVQATYRDGERLLIARCKSDRALFGGWNPYPALAIVTKVLLDQLEENRK